jgi:hypothetical protein
VLLVLVLVLRQLQEILLVLPVHLRQILCKQRLLTSSR